jgi:TetR/AcrR family transcriptional regulator, transcriptional repressor for nem operon
MVRETTKQKVLEVGAEIIHLKGFNHTGIQEVLQAAGVPKGSFYNYFKNKEDFGLHVIDHFIGVFSAVVEPVIEDPSLPPLEKIRGMLDLFIEFFRGRDFSYGCPVGNLAQEMGDLSPAFREKLNEAFDSMADIYMSLIREGQSNGEISERIHAEDTAYFIVTSWHGALGHMKIKRSTQPLESHIHFIFNYILTP